MSAHRSAPLPRAILSGEGEGAFDHLPGTVIANLRRPNSENARLWNSFCPRPGRALTLRRFLAVPPLWGTAVTDEPDDLLVPYFWGHHASGPRLEGLDEALAVVDGQGPRTEVDLILRGTQHLVMVEAKNLSAFGRCGRYQRRACPEVHRSAEHWLDSCRYWEVPPARFHAHLDFGLRPGPGTLRPPCAGHYQLARTLLVGQVLAASMGLTLHVWVLMPRERWASHERIWLDFVSRVRDPDLWRRMRVVGWQDMPS